MRKPQPHVIYGLSLIHDPRVILYVGSSLVSKYPDRVREHQSGNVPTTRKMAAKNGVSPSDLRARTMRRWVGPGGSPEAHVTRLMQAFGLARWNHPYAFSSDASRRGALARYAKYGNSFSPEDNRRGGRNGTREVQIAAARAMHKRTLADGTHPFLNPDICRKGALSPRRSQERAGEAGRKAGKKGGPIRAHLRWHIARGIVSPACALCMEVHN